MSDPMCGIEHLTGFKNHLDHMLIGMGLRSFLGVVGKNKEVHLGAGIILPGCMVSNFL
jgi:hypothetical protein